MNSTYDVECGSGEPLRVTLQDGHWADAVSAGSTDITLTEVHELDVDPSDDADEVVVELTCTGGAKGFFEQALLFDEVAGSPARVGRPVIGQQVERQGANFEASEPYYDDFAPLCCPSHTSITTYSFDADEPGFVPIDSRLVPYTGSGQAATESASLSPGEPCAPGSHEDCTDETGDGTYRYVPGHAACRAEYPNFYEICVDLDNDGSPGYSDSR